MCKERTQKEDDGSAVGISASARVVTFEPDQGRGASWEDRSARLAEECARHAQTTGEPRRFPGSPGSPVALRLERVTLSFGGVMALAEIDLAVARGEVRAVIGPNGAGKSSLLNIISGIYRPDRGRVWIGDR
ncbi:MAG: ATP-binding cassette domain-containing protein, partial [Verrucomicrobia bacterium]|nr:ATP-binding cassette domain-containing protein [Verrucomicrobiota bacterium]